MSMIGENDAKYDEVRLDYERARNKWSMVQNRHIDLRQEHLEQLAEVFADKHNTKHESALKQIINSETSKSLHERHRGIFKEPRKSLRSVLVPKKVRGWVEIKEIETINNLLLRVSEKKLKSSIKRCPLMKPPFLI